MSGDLVLAKLDTARLALSEAKTIQDAKGIIDIAHAAEIYAKRQGASQEAIDYAHSIKIEALRRLGEMLIDPDTPKNKGAQGRMGGGTRGTKKEPQVDPVPTYAEIGLDKKTASIAQRLATLPAKQFEEVRAGTASITEALTTASEIRKSNTPHVAANSGENEWYTPVEYIDAARSVLGEIDCDPASSAQANETVKARKFFSASDDGRSRKWGKRVWMNPPYAQPLCGEFCDLLASKVESGEVEAAIVLVNNATETAWFARLVSVSSALVFPRGRVRFLDPGGKPGAPLQGQAIIYCGGERKSFFAAFGGLGWQASLK